MLDHFVSDPIVAPDWYQEPEISELDINPQIVPESGTIEIYCQRSEQRGKS